MLRYTAPMVALLVVVSPACAQRPGCHDPQTTIEMRRCLAQDLRQAEDSLRVVEDTLAKALDDSAGVRLRQARQMWEQYRKQQCDAVAAVFLPGTMGPVMELQCLIEATEQRRKLLLDMYSSQL